MNLTQNKLLSELTTFGIGGPASWFTEARSLETLRAALIHCQQHDLRHFILGKGSNSLFDDRGFDGMVILNKIDFIDYPTQNQFHVGAGYSFSLLGTQTARQGFAGLEFASGIPGSVGGAVFMNAGANGSETFECLVSVDYLDLEGHLHVISKKDLHFSYRYSDFQHLPGVIVGATFELSSSENARTKQLEIIHYRKKTQPYNDKSAGCVFRNPICNYAGALIECSGLKGLQYGEAQISEHHANFIINKGSATCHDVLSLIATIKMQVKEKMNVELESEIRHIPYIT